MEYKVSKNTKEAVLYQCYDRWSTTQVVVRALFFAAVIIGPVWIMSKSYEWRHSPWTPWLFWLGALGPLKVFWRKSKARTYVEDFNNRVKTLLADANAAHETKFEYEKNRWLAHFRHICRIRYIVEKSIVCVCLDESDRGF